MLPTDALTTSSINSDYSVSAYQVTSAMPEQFRFLS